MLFKVFWILQAGVGADWRRFGHPSSRVSREYVGCSGVWPACPLVFTMPLYLISSHSLPHFWFYSSPSEIWNGLVLICLNVTLWGEAGLGDEQAASAKPWEWMKAWQLSCMLTDELLSSVYPDEKPWCARSGWRGLGERKKNMPQSKQLDSLWYLH